MSATASCAQLPAGAVRFVNTWRDLEDSQTVQLSCYFEAHPERFDGNQHKANG